MNFAKIILLPLILQVSHPLLSAEPGENTALVTTSSDHSHQKTIIAQCIRKQNKSQLACLLAQDATIPVDDLIKLARRKDEKYNKNCCRNLRPLAVSVTCALSSLYIAMEPSYCRNAVECGNRGGIRVLGWWLTPVTGVNALYCAKELGKDLGNYFYSKNIVGMLEEYKAKQQANDA